jgi:hypothetical protein
MRISCQNQYGDSSAKVLRGSSGFNCDSGLGIVTDAADCVDEDDGDVEGEGTGARIGWFALELTGSDVKLWTMSTS